MIKDPELKVKCKTCKKSAKNCRCFIFRIEHPSEFVGKVFADNVATAPVRGESAGTWQPRRNARVWLRPQFVDGILVLTFDWSDKAEIEEAINNGTFFIDDYEGREDFKIPTFDKNLRKRLPIFRRARTRK